MCKLALVVNDMLIGRSRLVQVMHVKIGGSEIGKGGHRLWIIGGRPAPTCGFALVRLWRSPKRYGVLRRVVHLCPSVCALSGVGLSRGIRFETRFHRAFKGAINVFRSWKEPFLLIIALIVVLVDGERPLLPIPGVFQPTNGMETSIVLPIQIEKLALVARDIPAMRVAYCCGIEVLDNVLDVRLDLVGYPSRGGAFRAGFALGSLCDEGKISLGMWYSSTRIA
jgi:hypothetical protein